MANYYIKDSNKPLPPTLMDLIFFDKQVDHVLPNLFIGSLNAANDPSLLAANSVTHVLSLGFEANPQSTNIKYAFFDILDEPDSDLSKVLDGCLAFVESAINQGGRVFVHCKAGISRSASVVIAYLMKNKGMSYDCAYHYLKGVRPHIHPNIGFVKQLKLFEKKINSLS